MNDYEPDRDIFIGTLRRKVIIAAMRSITDAFENPGIVTPFQDGFDEAVKALAAKLNEPETCYACGQPAPGDR